MINEPKIVHFNERGRTCIVTQWNGNTEGLLAAVRWSSDGLKGKCVSVLLGHIQPHVSEVSNFG